MIGDQTLTYRRYAQMAKDMAKIVSGQGEYELADALWRFEQQMYAQVMLTRIEQANEVLRGQRLPVVEELEDYREHGLLSRWDYERLMREAMSRQGLADAGRITTGEAGADAVAD